MKGTAKYLAYYYYALSVLVLSIYGFRIYPSLVPPPVLQTLAGFILPFLFVALSRRRLEAWLVERRDSLDQPWRQLLLDFGLYFVIGSLLFMLEYFFYAHPILLAGKIFAATLIIGYFASIDNALTRERLCFETQNSPENTEFEPSSVTDRLNLFLTITVLIALTAITSSGYGFLQLVGTNTVLTAGTIQEAFLIDALFIFGIIISLTIRLIHSYSQNMQYLFDTEIKVLRKVQRGELNEFVPVLSRDEFGVIAQQTNRMIEDMREKEKIRKTLEQIVSPNIMQKLLGDDADTLQQGQEFEVAILFCDLREFTSYAENTPPEEVIFFLNTYFSKLADIVTEHRGVINKFMGDAILAVFGIEGGDTPVEDAIASSWDILSHSRAIRMGTNKPFDIGVGIHAGSAVAGTIGSADRYEYTFIGDVVNTASRLDGLSKRLGFRIIISETAYIQISSATRERFTDLGEHRLRGKSELVHIYGAIPGEVIED